MSTGGQKYQMTVTRGPTIMPAISPVFVTIFQNRDKMIGGPKHVASPAHANTASQNTESSGFRAMMIANAPSAPVAILEMKIVLLSRSSPFLSILFHRSSAIVDDAIKSIESIEDIIADSAPATMIPASHHGKSSTAIVGNMCSGSARSGNKASPESPMSTAP